MLLPRLMRRVQVISLLLFLLTFAVFSRLLFADFVQWDDDINVYNNPNILGLSWEHLSWMFTDASHAMRYKPLTWVCYAMICQIFGMKPFPFHLMSLLMHSVNAVLVFHVIRRILAATQSKGVFAERLEHACLPAASGALLWALNPLRVEPVARVTDFTYCLLLFFLMISLWCYVRAFEAPMDAQLRRRFYWCSVVFFALSMLSYPLAFGWVFVLLVLDWYPLRRFTASNRWKTELPSRAVLIEKIPFLVLGGLVLVTLFARLKPTGIWADQSVDVSSFNLISQGLQAFYVWSYYAWKPWWPLDLSPVYTSLVNFRLDLGFWLSALFVIGLTALLAVKRRQWPWAFALWVCHLVLLLPVLGLTERFHYTSDRYDYLPGVLWGVFAGACLLGLRHRLVVPENIRRRSWRGGLVLGSYWVVGFLSLASAVMTVHQSRIWQNTVALFEYTIEELGANPYSGEMHCRLAQFLTSQRRNTEAIVHYEQALEVLPGLVPALNNLAWIRATDSDETNRDGARAVTLAEAACSLTSYRSPIMLGTLAASYAEAGKFEQAIVNAQKAHDLAVAAGQQELAIRNLELLELYRAGRPYRETLVPIEKTRKL